MDIGSKVLVFDRYRFAIALEAKILKFSDCNDGVEIELLQSNNPFYPIGAKVWVHDRQLEVVKGGQ